MQIESYKLGVTSLSYLGYELWVDVCQGLDSGPGLCPGAVLALEGVGASHVTEGHPRADTPATTHTVSVSIRGIRK